MVWFDTWCFVFFEINFVCARVYSSMMATGYRTGDSNHVYEYVIFAQWLATRKTATSIQYLKIQVHSFAWQKSNRLHIWIAIGLAFGAHKWKKVTCPIERQSRYAHDSRTIQKSIDKMDYIHFSAYWIDSTIIRSTLVARSRTSITAQIVDGDNNKKSLKILCARMIYKFTKLFILAVQRTMYNISMTQSKRKIEHLIPFYCAFVMWCRPMFDWCFWSIGQRSTDEYLHFLSGTREQLFRLSYGSELISDKYFFLLHPQLFITTNQLRSGEKIEHDYCLLIFEWAHKYFREFFFVICWNRVEKFYRDTHMSSGIWKSWNELPIFIPSLNHLRAAQHQTQIHSIE